jgi:hypothetical protein
MVLTSGFFVQLFYPFMVVPFSGIMTGVGETSLRNLSSESGFPLWCIRTTLRARVLLTM